MVSVERDNIGYDLHATRTGREEHLEVKGTRGAEASLIITAGEVRRMRTDPTVRLCVVTDALCASPTLWSWLPAEAERTFRCRRSATGPDRGNDDARPSAGPCSRLAWPRRAGLMAGRGWSVVMEDGRPRAPIGSGHKGG